MRAMERGLAVSTLLVVLAALGLTAGLLQLALDPEATPATSLGQVFSRNIVATRVATGLLIILGWPLILHGASNLLNVRFQRPSRFMTLLAILLGCLTYVLTFLPGQLALIALIVPVGLAPLLFRLVLRLRWAHAARLWALQALALTTVVALSVWGLESMAARTVLNPLHEAPIIYTVTQRPLPGFQQLVAAAHGSAFPPMRWAPSGSHWLDRRANQVQVEVVNPERQDNSDITLRPLGDGRVIETARPGSTPWRSVRFIPVSDRPYSLVSASGPLPGDVVRVYSLLPLIAP
jgi:hypothetical protein